MKPLNKIFIVYDIESGNPISSNLFRLKADAEKYIKELSEMIEGDPLCKVVEFDVVEVVKVKETPDANQDNQLQ